MGAQIRIKIDDVLVERVVSVEAGLDVAAGHDGHPQDDRPRLTTIRITRESDTNLAFWLWSLTPFAEGYKGGMIEFLDPTKEDSTIHTITWEDGFVSSYREDVPHIQFAKEAPVTETIEVSARVVDLDGSKLEGYKA